MKYVFSYIGNFIWKIFGGVWLAAFWVLLGLAFTLSIVGFPIAVKCYKIAWLSWKPSSRRASVNIERYFIFNVLWFALVSWFVLPFAIISMAFMILTIFGLPLAYQWFKVLKVCLFPFGAVIK